MVKFEQQKMMRKKKYTGQTQIAEGWGYFVLNRYGSKFV